MYLLVCTYRLRPKQQCSKRNACCCSVFSVSFSVPQVKYDFLYDHYHVCCQESWRSLTHRQAYTTFIMVALFLLPLAAMLFLYTRIGIELWIRKRVGDSSVLNTMNQREISKISRYCVGPQTNSKAHKSVSNHLKSNMHNFQTFLFSVEHI